MPDSDKFLARIRRRKKKEKSHLPPARSRSYFPHKVNPDASPSGVFVFMSQYTCRGRALDAVAFFTQYTPEVIAGFAVPAREAQMCRHETPGRRTEDPIGSLLHTGGRALQFPSPRHVSFFSPTSGYISSHSKVTSVATVAGVVDEAFPRSGLFSAGHLVSVSTLAARDLISLCSTATAAFVA